MGLFSRKKKSDIEERQFFPLVSGTWGTSVFPPEKNACIDTIVSLISGTISTLPMGLYVHTRNGLQEAWSHNVARLLKDPAVEETNTLFWKTVVRHLLLTGNAYIFKHKYDREVVTLEIIDPLLIRVDRSPSGRKLYTISGERGGVYTDADVIQICYPDDGYGGTRGLSPCQVHIREILRNDLIAEYISVFFKNGIGSRLLVELDKDDYKAGSPKMEKLLQEFNTYFNTWVLGVDNANRPIITPPSSKITKIEQSNNQQAMVLELYDQSCAELARLFNVPPEVIYSKESKYNSLESKRQDYYSICLLPLCKHITETLEKGLLSPEEKGRYVIKYDFSGLLEIDVSRKTDLWIKKYQSGVCSLNELRAALDMSKIEDETIGDTHWIPGNLIPMTADNIESILAKSKLALKEAEAQGQMTPAEKDEEGHNPVGRDMNL